MVNRALFPILLALLACVWVVGEVPTFGQTLPTLTVTGVTPNNSSARIFYNPFPGAKDYRVYDVANPLEVKYAGQAHYVPADNCPGVFCLAHFAANADGSIKFPYEVVHDNSVGIGTSVLDVPANDVEWNGGGDRLVHTLIVEALDALGPAPRANLYTGEAAGPNVPLAAGGMLGSNKGPTTDGNISTNGQGPWTNIPNVIARSPSFLVQAAMGVVPVPSSPNVSQVFLDTFEQSEAANFVQTARDDAGGDTVGNLGVMNFSLNAGTMKEWAIEYRQADNQNSMPFISSAHFMDMLFDGATPGTNAPPHTIYGSMAMSPKQTIDVVDGNIVHLTMEVDSHPSFRRWMAFDLSPASAPLQAWEATLHKINGPNQGLFFEMLAHRCSLTIYNGPATNQPPTASYVSGCGSGEMYLPAIFMEGGRGLDDRSRLDLFVSQTHLAAFQDNKLLYQTSYPATAMPWFQGAVKAYYTHYTYHTTADYADLTQFTLNGAGFCFPLNSYWFNDAVNGTAASATTCNRAYPAGYGFRYSDERHWDNMGFEVLPSSAVNPTDFTALGSLVALPQPQSPQFGAVMVSTATPTPLPPATATAIVAATATQVTAATATAVAGATATPSPTISATSVPGCVVLTRLNGVEHAYTRPVRFCTDQ